MWFGNLTTMVWWTHLWLNEGFARFMEFGAVDFLFPKWKVWDIFVQQVSIVGRWLVAFVISFEHWPGSRLSTLFGCTGEYTSD